MSFSSQKTTQVVREYLLALDCPRSLTVWILFESGEHQQLVDLEFNPVDYNNQRNAADALAATKFLSKATFLQLNVDRRKVALEKFFEAERVCAATNRRIRECRLENGTVAILSRMQRKISQILDSCCSGVEISGEEIISLGGWGPGATTTLPRRLATQPTKFQIESGITADAHDFVKDWFLEAYPLWSLTNEGYPEKFQFSHAKIVTVPKNAKTDRTIAVEPGINLWFQKAIGSAIRRRLVRTGIDLNHQTHNQKKARLASKFNYLATIDFSAASDTIARALVEELVPQRWFVLMEAFRSKIGKVDGELLYFHKFSSMGNGFTFELESLIFYALAFAVCEAMGVETSEISVFGDDVILPSVCVDAFSHFSADLGFTVNKAKSYSSSYYRESCGSHYWNGNDIKPIFLKEPLNDAMEILKFSNNVRRLAHRRNSYGCDRKFRRCWEILARYVGRKCPRISEGYGDLGLIVNFDEVRDHVPRARHGLEGYLVRIWASVAAQFEIEHSGLLLYKLQLIGSDGVTTGNKIPVPCRTRLSSRTVLVPRWYDLGPWI